MEEDLPLSTIDQEKDSLKRNESKLSGLVKEVIEEINLVRTNPKEYIKKLNDLKKYLSVKENIFQNNKEIIIIPQIEQQYEELISHLSSRTPLDALIENEYLSSSCEEVILTLQKYEKKDDNTISNYIIDLSNRLKKYGIINGAIGEIIDLGVNDNAELIVLKLLLDEKDDKTERDLILSDKIKYVGGSYYEFGFTDNIIVALDFSEKLSMKMEKTIINLNIKIAIERLGKSFDSSRLFLYKKKRFDEDKKIISAKFSNFLTRNILKNSNNHQPISNNKGFIFNKENNNSKQKNIKIPSNSKNTVSDIEQTNEEDSIKSLKINDSLLKASSLIKKMPGKINYNNTKIVNINVNIENEGKDLKKQTSTISSDKKGKNIPSSTKSTIQSQNFKSNTNKNFDEILLSDDSRSDNGEVERKNNFKAQTIDTNNYPVKPPTNKNARKITNRSTVGEESRKPMFEIKNDSQRASSGSYVKEKTKMIDYTDKKQFDKEILSNKNIKCMKINKTIGVDDDGKEYYIIKKTIFFNNNSTEEWIFKEEI